MSNVIQFPDRSAYAQKILEREIIEREARRKKHEDDTLRRLSDVIEDAASEMYIKAILAGSPPDAAFLAEAAVFDVVITAVEAAAAKAAEYETWGALEAVRDARFRNLFDKS